jgi:DNA-directed RNA polymerase subunit RPC12/RpoP
MISEGTKVICVECKKHIYTTARDIGSGDVPESAQFADAGFGVPENGDKAVCPNCGASIFPSIEALL